MTTNDEDVPIPQELEIIESIATFASERIRQFQVHWEGIGFEGSAAFREAYDMYALLAQLVSTGTFAVVENCGRQLVGRYGVQLSERPVWGEIRQRIEEMLGYPLENLPGFQTVDTVRQLANCFKHKDGWPDRAMIETCRPHVREMFLGNSRGWIDPLFGRSSFWADEVDLHQNIKQVRIFLRSLLTALPR